MDLSETIVVHDIKFGRCSQLSNYMKLHEYQRSSSFIDLRRRSLRFKIFKLFSLESAESIKAKLYVKPPWDGEMKVNTNGLYHMTKVAAIPYIW